MTEQHPCPGPGAFHPDPATPPLVTEPLCGGCCTRTRQALRDLPELYTQLWMAMVPSQQAGQSGRVTGTREPPLPLDAEPRLLMDRALEVIGSWAEAVIAAQRLADPVPVPGGGGRLDGWVMSSGCALLARHLQAWIQLPAQAMVRRVDLDELQARVGTGLDGVPGRTMAGGAWLTLDLPGWQGALEVLAVKQRARVQLGLVRGRDRLPEPCPNPLCERRSLVRWHGADQVECEACGESWPERDYARLVKVLVSYRDATKRKGRT